MESAPSLTPATAALEESKWTRRLWRILFLLLLMLGVSLMLVTLLQRKLIYHPTRVAAMKPEQWGFEPHRCLLKQLTTPDGIVLNGWHVLPPFHQALNAEEEQLELQLERPAILVFSGNAGHRGYRATLLRRLSSLQADVFLFDYRGFAENAGQPTEAALLQDAEQIWNWMTEDLKIPPARILIVGESLGGGVATALASKVCQQNEIPGGLCLKATFSSLTEVAQKHYPYLPVQIMLIDRFPSAQRIADVRCPIRMLHGMNDTIVPFALGKKLFEAAPKHSLAGIAPQFLELPGIGHNDILENAGDDYLRIVEEMLNQIRNLKTTTAPATSTNLTSPIPE